MITGATGFIGGFLAKYCADAGCSVLGMGVQEPTDTWPGAGTRFESCDIRGQARVLELLSSFRPQRIFHLAAQSYPTVSMFQPRETMDINAGGTINLYECLRTSGVAATVVVACSSAEYGPVAAENLPVRETHPLSPLHPYGVSKVAQDLLASQYYANYGIPSIRIRIFNTTGPGKIGDVCSDLTRRAAEIEARLRPSVLTAGNTINRRAIADVRDLVRGLWLAAEHCTPGDVYNLGGSAIYAVQEVINIIQTLAKVPFRLEQDPALLRPCDELVIAGDTSKFRACTGWKPEIPLADTVRDMLDWWRAQLAADPSSPTFLPDRLPQELSA